MTRLEVFRHHRFMTKTSGARAVNAMKIQQHFPTKAAAQHYVANMIPIAQQNVVNATIAAGPVIDAGNGSYYVNVTVWAASQYSRAEARLFL